MEKNNLQIEFHGGVGSVTGANFILTDGSLRIMIDCGMKQGSDEDAKTNYEEFPYDPKEVDVVFITHAHADHIGRLPKLIRDGFEGKIFSTVPTRDISEIMFADSAEHVMRDFEEQQLSEPMFTEAHVKKTLGLWNVEKYHTPITLAEGVSATLYDAGHILGSSMIVFDWKGTRIAFTGDLGNSPAPLLRDTEMLDNIDYMVMESVYGSRNHEDRDLRTIKLENVLSETIDRGGVVMIPAFSVERTQEVIFEINSLVEAHKIPKVPIYLDSPLSIKVTDVYRNTTEFFNEEAKKKIANGDDVFDFIGFEMTETVAESKEINEQEGAKIIIAGSGMSNGGRILHHEKRYLSQSKNTLVIVGYQAAGTLGRIIQDGASSVRIDDEFVSVRAHIETISGFSGHKQRDDLIEFVAHTASTLKTVWCAMGEYESSTFLAQRLRDYHNVNAIVPEPHTIVTIPLNPTS